MKHEPRRENDNLLFSLGNISPTELTIIETILEKELENNEEKLKYFNKNNVQNKNTEWLEDSSIAVDMAIVLLFIALIAIIFPTML